MLSFLFPRLTAQPDRGADLFAAVVNEARQPHWYVEGQVPDSLDGRFAVLATVTALVLVRLEQGDDADGAASVALTERFVGIMEAEHRELGLGDPALGRKVRKLVSALGRRVELWRSAVATEQFEDATRESLALDAGPAAIRHSQDALRALWKRLQATAGGQVAKGRLA
jgi:cytochrome b pre-mRNA-processing protein 3